MDLWRTYKKVQQEQGVREIDGYRTKNVFGTVHEISGHHSGGYQ